jgi:four helix bundle protein
VSLASLRMKVDMLRIYEDTLRLVRLLRPLLVKIGRHSRSLRKQVEDAGNSVPLNTAEGSYRHGGHQRERFDTAIGSAREVRAGLHIAIAAGYLTDVECEEALDCADKIAATLWSCLRGSKRRSA